MADAPPPPDAAPLPPPPDAAAPQPDAAPPPPDAAPLAPDAAAPKPDAATPDAAPLPPDAAPPPPDAASPDAALPPPDAAVPPPDAAPPPDAPAPLPSAGGVTDLTAHAPPALTLPAAGGSFVDPIFGTTLIRVTDAQDGTRCNHAYSYWSAFNGDGTRLLIACDDTPRLYRFIAATDTLVYDGPLRGSDGPSVQLEGATWSRANPNILYALDGAGTRLWRIDVTVRGLAGFTLLKDFGPWVAGLRVYQLSVSDDENVFTFTTRTSTGVKKEAFAWLRAIDSVRQYPRPADLAVDETHVAKSGAEIMVSWQDGHMTLWNPAAGTSADYMVDATDKVNGHFDLGHDFIANSDGWNTGVLVRTWAGTHSPKNVLQYRRTTGSLNWSLADHVSLRADLETYAVVSTYAGDGTWQPFEDEIFLVRTDGGGFVRLAHTRSYGANTDSAVRYYSQPRAVVDRTGRYIVFTSDLGSTSRMDVLILKVPPAYWP